MDRVVAYLRRGAKLGETENMRIRKGYVAGDGANGLCGSKEFGSPPFPFPPSGASRGGRVPPTPDHVASQPKPLARAMRRLPPQEGLPPPCGSPA
jgi:hypothetical protein